jgi:3'-phosphoadenosine 5'-phosphosulfate (PAPS) 3'-phosphatase
VSDAAEDTEDTGGDGDTGDVDGDRAGSAGSFDLDALRAGVEGAVREASEAIRGVLRQRTVRVGHKPGEGPVTEADYAADDVLRKHLMALIPEAHWLSEESEAVAPLIHGEPTWVIDPLDGTREFLRGLPEYGVSVGLFLEDRLVLGAVGLPVQDEVYSGICTAERQEASKNGVALPRLPDDGIVQRVVVSRHDYEWRRIQYQLPWEVYPLGSAVCKLVHAATQDADIYFSTGPRSVWDVAGGAAVLRGVGGVLMQINGRPLGLSPQQVSVPPYAAGAPADCLALLRALGAPIEES